MGDAVSEEQTRIPRFIVTFVKTREFSIRFLSFSFLFFSLFSSLFCGVHQSVRIWSLLPLYAQQLSRDCYHAFSCGRPSHPRIASQIE